MAANDRSMAYECFWCRVSVAAKELPDRRVVLQAKVASMLSRPASITQAVVSAPAGYEVQELPHELQSLYPLQVCLPVSFGAAFLDEQAFLTSRQP